MILPSPKTRQICFGCLFEFDAMGVPEAAGLPRTRQHSSFCFSCRSRAGEFRLVEESESPQSEDELSTDAASWENESLSALSLIAAMSPLMEM